MLLREEIKSRRRALGLTKSELANKMGVSAQSVSRWESGLANPAPDKISMLAEILNVTPEFLGSLSNKAETDLDVMRQNLLPATGIMSVLFIQGLTLGIFPYLGLTPSDAVNIYFKIEGIKNFLQRRLKQVPSRTEILSQFPDKQLTNAKTVYDYFTSSLMLLQYNYSILKTCTLDTYPQTLITSHILDIRDFEEKLLNPPALNSCEQQVFTIKQDEPFYLTKFGFHEEKSFIAINRQSINVHDGNVYLYSYDGRCELARFTGALEDHYTLSTDRIEKTIAKNDMKTLKFQIVGQVLNWA